MPEKREQSMTDEQIDDVIQIVRTIYGARGGSHTPAQWTELRSRAHMQIRDALPTPAPTMVDSEYPPLPDAVAHSLGLAKYAHSSNIIAANEFTPDTEHADEWEALYTASQMRAYVDADRATRPALQSLGGDAGVSEREAFEAFIRKDAGDLNTFGSGANVHYQNSAVNNAWGGWKARAALSLTSTEKSDGAKHQVVSAKVHEEDSNLIHATLYAPVLKDFTLEATRDEEKGNWYVKVTDEGGYYLYDGYWRDSDRKTCAEVLAEAASGALLHTLESPPAEASPIALPAAPKAAGKSGGSE